MRAKIAAWRRRQRSSVLFVAIPAHGTTITPAGLRSSQRLVMVEARR